MVSTFYSAGCRALGQFGAFLDVGDHGLVTVELLSDKDAAALRAVPLSYTRDRTVEGAAPAGYRHLHVARRLKRRDFDGASRDLLGWQMHAKAGLRVQASESPAQTGTVVLMRLGPGPLALRIPCRVLQVFDEPRRKGFFTPRFRDILNAVKSSSFWTTRATVTSGSP